MNEIWIKPRTDGFPGKGSQADPFNGANPDRLDGLLRGLPPNQIIRFHSGEYLTRGYHAGAINLSNIWQLKPGWKMLGAGIDSTFLRLVDAQREDTGYSVIGSEYNSNCDHAIIDGFTIDANVDGHGKKVVAQIIGVYGSHIRISNVRGIRWGTLNQFECFAIGASGGHENVGPKEGNRIERSFLDTPTPNMSDAGAIGFCVFGGSTPKLFHAVPALRRNSVNAAGAKNVRAYAFAGVVDGLIDENLAIHCNNGVYSDSGCNAGIRIYRNRFLDVVSAVNFNYYKRLDSPVEPDVDIMDNVITIRAGEGAAGVALLGTEFDGPASFRRVRVVGNSIHRMDDSPSETAGVAVFRAGRVEVQDNDIGQFTRRIDLRKVISWSVKDEFCA